MLVIFQAHWPPLCFSTVPCSSPPQGLCTCCSFTLGTLSCGSRADASQFSGLTSNATCLGKPSVISPVGYIFPRYMYSSSPGLFLDRLVTTGIKYLASAYLFCQSTNSTMAGIISIHFTIVYPAACGVPGNGRCPTII